MNSKSIVNLLAVAAAVGISSSAMADDSSRIQLSVANAGHVSANVPTGRSTTIGVYTQDRGIRRVDTMTTDRGYALVRRDSPKGGTHLLFVPVR